MKYSINKAVVIGSGTMGSSIAAHLANAGISVTLLDIVPPVLLVDGKIDSNTSGELFEDRNSIARENLIKCLKTRPPAFFSKRSAERIDLGNLEDNFEAVSSADWIIEAIVENIEIKKSLMEKIEKYRKDKSIVTTNTSGLLIRDIAEGRSENFKKHFLGTHFFNPPRYMKLIEVIPNVHTGPEVLLYMKEFCERVLGKNVVVCKDTPNFIANRYISFVIGYIMKYAFEYGFSIPEVDNLTGELIGRPKTATFRLNDLIGIDLIAQVNKNLYTQICDDPYRSVLLTEKTVTLLEKMVEKNLLGNKTNGGFYRMLRNDEGKKILALDTETLEYGEPSSIDQRFLEKYLSINPLSKRLLQLFQDAWAKKDDDNARNLKFIWQTTAFTLNYSAWAMPEISENLYSFDQVVKLGFGHEMGPFEIWDVVGVAECAKHLEELHLKVPEWVMNMLKQGNDSFYKTIDGKKVFYDPASSSYKALPEDPKAFNITIFKTRQNVLIECNNDASLIDLQDGVLGLEFHSKANAINYGVFDMIEKAAQHLEDGRWFGMVIANDGKNFSAGADLGLFIEHIENSAWDKMDTLVEKLQKTLLKFRYSRKPVVAAPFGMTLGGGSEVMLASSAICAYAETYIGQIEPSVGVVPALGGSKEPLRRVLSPIIQRIPTADPLPALMHVFQLIAMNKVSGSALEAKEWGFLAHEDRIVMKREYLLYSAKKMVMDMVDSGYVPAIPKNEIYAVGPSGLSYLKAYIYNMFKAGYITEHEKLISEKLAYVLCGGSISESQWVDATYILDLEREAFVSLLGEEKTRERVYSVLKTGKHIRN